jgi:hypothetical protein
MKFLVLKKRIAHRALAFDEKSDGLSMNTGH